MSFIIKVEDYLVNLNKAVKIKIIDMMIKTSTKQHSKLTRLHIIGALKGFKSSFLLR